MLVAYFDETNTSPNQRVPVVAGYLASTFQWSRFTEQWDKLLRHYKIPIDPRHGVRLVHRNKLQHRKDSFAQWTETERDEFVQKAYAVIKRHTKMAVGNAVSRNLFETIESKAFQKAIGGPYGWCAYTCLHSVKAYCDNQGHNEPVKFVFEMGAPGYRQVNSFFSNMCRYDEMLKYFRVGSISFAGKAVRQLQAADFLAYDLGRAILDHELNRRRVGVIESLRALLGPKIATNNHVRFWDETVLRKHAQSMEDDGLFALNRDYTKNPLQPR